MGYARKTERGDIFLVPSEFVARSGPGGLPIGSVTLSRMGVATLWFMRFLRGEEVPDECEINGHVYKASRDASGVFLKDTRDRNVNVVGFSTREVPIVLAEIEQIIAD
jgi:hypothetical protein